MPELKEQIRSWICAVKDIFPIQGKLPERLDIHDVLNNFSIITVNKTYVQVSDKEK